MPVSPYRPSAFERLVVFLTADRAHPTTVTIARPQSLCPDKPLCPDKSNK